MGAAGETANIDLYLYTWNASGYAATIGQTPIASQTSVNISTTPVWLELTFSPQSSTGQYLISAKINSMTYVSAGFGVGYSNSGDGGTNNDAYNDASIKTDREYLVQLNLMPEPGTLMLLALGIPALFKRRR